MIKLYLGIKLDIYFKMGKQNEQLIKNMENYAKKNKTKQQESKVLVKRKIGRAKNKEKNINVYYSNRSESLWSMVRKRLKLWKVMNL
tara:strand:- start:5287 stop:5547 length:261 start_codon:yes stop_codon:yes gene_type:complete